MFILQIDVCQKRQNILKLPLFYATMNNRDECISRKPENQHKDIALVRNWCANHSGIKKPLQIKEFSNI